MRKSRLSEWERMNEMDQPQPRASFLKRKGKSPGDEAGKRQSSALRPINVVCEFSVKL